MDHAFQSRSRPPGKGSLLLWSVTDLLWNPYHSMPLNFLKLSILILMLSNSSWEV
jgi:hypothetical protein